MLVKRGNCCPGCLKIQTFISANIFVLMAKGVLKMLDFNAAGKQSVPSYRPPVKDIDPISSFQKELAKYQLDPGEIVPDGNIHRFDVDKSNDKAGWYVLHHGEVCGAVFGNWKEGVKVNWCSHESSQMSDEQSKEYQKKIKEAEEKRKSEETKNQKAAQKSALKRLTVSATFNHPYLINKKVSHYLLIHLHFINV